MESVVVAKAETRRARFKCARCHHVRDVEVRVDGAGTSIVGRRLDAAERTAARQADAEMAANTETMLGLVPCPQCGRRDARALANLFMWSAIPALMFGALAIGLSFIGGAALVLALPFAMAALGVPLLGRRSLERARKTVRFLE